MQAPRVTYWRTRHRRVALPTNARRIALGAYIVDWGMDAPNDYQPIDDWTQMVGRAPASIFYDTSWGDTYNNFSTHLPSYLKRRGIAVKWNWNPQPGDNGVNVASDYKTSLITAGNFDSYITSVANDIKSFGNPVYIRFASEMNGTWTLYNEAVGNPNGNATGDFAAMWRHVWGLFAAAGATNAKWIWVVNSLSASSPDPTQYYPGDAYVDYIGFDAYCGVGGSGTYTTWYDLAQPVYAKIQTIAPSKPVIVGEMGCSEPDGTWPAGMTKGNWIDRAFFVDMPRLPAIVWVHWFHENKSGQGESDWRVDSSGSGLAAFQRVVASPLYSGKVPR